MSKGKRVASKKNASHRQSNDMSQTGKINQHSLHSDTEACFMDGNDWPTKNIYTSEKPSPCPNCNRNYTEVPKESPKFNFWEFWTLFLFFSVVGMLLYDYIAPEIVPFISIIAGIFTILPPESSGKSHRPVRTALILSAVLSFVVCNSLGLRLRLVPTTTTDSVVSPTIESASILASTPTPTPTAIQAGIESNPDAKNPIIITPHPDQEAPIIQHVRLDFLNLLHLDTSEQDTLEFTSGNIHLCMATFVDEIKKTVSTEGSYDANGNIDKSFQEKTKLANDLYAEYDEHPDKIETIDLIIQYREEAYNIIPMPSLCNLLADDYYRLALEYKKIEDQGNTYQCYYSAVKWELAYIRSLRQIDDSFYSALYFIATAYYGIGNSDWLPDIDRIDAHYISACLYGAASKNTFAGGDKQYLSCIYAGMANHALLNLSANIDPSEHALYFTEAYTYYTQAVNFPSKDKKRIYEYLYQICTWAEQHSTTYPESLPLDSTTYRSYADEYKRLSA